MARREHLIEQLVSYRKIRNHEITLVFDGWKNGLGRESRTVTGGITVIYSSLGERADNVIKRIISKRQKKWVVVSSDRDIVASAWNNNCVPVDSETYYNLLVKAISIKDVHDEYKYEDDEEVCAHHKGNARRPSRKQKEINRVLLKL